MKRKQIVIVGGGGHAKVVIDAIKSSGKYAICGLVDPGLKKGDTVCGVGVLGGDSTLPSIFKKGVKYAFIGIGSIGNCSVRKRIYGNLKKIGFDLPVVVHPKAIVARDVKLGEGAFVAAGAVVAPGAIIGKNAILNTSSSVDHDCIIGDFVHVAPGAILSGGIRVGSETHIGTGAKLTQCLKIGDGCIIGAGQTIRHDMAYGEKSYVASAGASKKNKKVFIIAEAGVNHNGSIRLAKKLIDAACSAGADAVKFQTFKADLLVTKLAQKAVYQKDASYPNESLFNMLKRLELDVDAHKELIAYCKKKNILFLSTPFDNDSVELLARLGLNIFKIPSGEITNLPYLRHVGKLGKKAILSTGMANLLEVKEAVTALIAAGMRREKITVLHCNTEYPAPYEDANLRAMVKMGRDLKMEVGYSDHTPGVEVPIAAVAMGAMVIEKHLTLDRNMEGPDHKASLEPDELTNMIRSIRNVEKAMGNETKSPSPSERKNIDVSRKSIVASRSIRKGEIFTSWNITVKRPGTGISPMRWDTVIGKVARKNFKKDALVAL